ncbi:UNVERIFIED_ORG: tyrosinase [Shinella zoogloeoides]|nr:tyrosinase [Shinella zoogloeoides]
MKRRAFLALGAATIAAPFVARAKLASGTPVSNGKRVRRRLSSLPNDDPFFAAYAKAVELMHEKKEADPLSWIAQARIHADHCAHGSLEFFPWHRPYLSYFERICGSLIGDDNFALPYWHWGDNNGRLPDPFFTNGPLNVLSWTDSGSYRGKNWGQINTSPYRYARSDFGLIDSPFAGEFSATALHNLENAPSFSLLTGLTENPHGTVHVFTGGNKNFGLGDATGHFSSGLSPLDPIFWLHHANVDRIWAQSAISAADQLATITDPSKTYSGIFYNEHGDPAAPSLRSQFNLAEQDFTYDFLVPELLSQETRSLQEQLIAAQPHLQEFAAKMGLSREDANKETVVGNASIGEQAVIGAISRVDVKTQALAEAIISQKVVPRPLPAGGDAIGIEGRRIYAQFDGVQPLAASENNALKVFVNCPYLSSATPTTDPHYSGTISFFGCSPEICGKRTFVVDITEPLRFGLDRGTLSTGDVQLQLLSFSSDGTHTAAPVADFGSVQLISA